MHLLACHHDCWGLRVAFDLIPSMKLYHPVALAHEAENKQSGVGLVGLHWSDSSPAALTADSRTRLVLCTDSLSRDVYDVKCPFPWSNCLVLDMIQQKKPVACCILPGGGVWLCCNIQVLGSGFPDMLGWTPLIGEFLKAFLLQYLLIQESGPLGLLSFLQHKCWWLVVSACLTVHSTDASAQ